MTLINVDAPKQSGVLMQYVDEYRNSEVLRSHLAQLRLQASRRWVIMDVCGGQTHSLLRSGLEAALEDVIEFVHGPGCPVCVTPASVIDEAVELAFRDGVVVTTFGDMLRVPGNKCSLLHARGSGAKIRTVHSPIDAVALAQKEHDKHFVFLGVGFETTAPSTALAVLQANHLGLTNFSVLSHHVKVEPAMKAVMQMPDNRVQGFLAAGHVCAVTGYQHLIEFADQFHVPVVVTGFEPLDLLLGLTECIRSLEEKRPAVHNRYPRAVQETGNLHAMKMIEQVYQVATIPWRGLGDVQDGGLVMRPAWELFDSRRRFGLGGAAPSDDGECRSADVMCGRLKPPDCALFGTRCHPDNPVGAPMVSSEGACAAYFRYGTPRRNA